MTSTLRWYDSMSHEAAYRCDISLQQNHIHDTMWLDAATCRCNRLPIKMASWERLMIGLVIVVTATCRMCMPHEGTEYMCDILLLWRVTWIQTDLTSCNMLLGQDVVSRGVFLWGGVMATTSLMWQGLLLCLYTDQHWFSYCNYCTIPSSLHVINQRKCTVFQ